MVIDNELSFSIVFNMTQLRHYDHLGTARFITFSSYQRFPVFQSEAACLLFINELKNMRDTLKLRILGYVIMPEHVHLVLWPPDECRLGIVIGQMKARAARRILASWIGTIPNQLCHVDNESRSHQIFQRRCYDHNCRTAEIVKEKIIYCHNNPVIRGLVSDPREWKWSSHNWYHGKQDVPLAMDSEWI